VHDLVAPCPSGQTARILAADAFHQHLHAPADEFPVLLDRYLPLKLLTSSSIFQAFVPSRGE
jgi:hypothetical protein